MKVLVVDLLQVRSHEQGKHRYMILGHRWNLELSPRLASLTFDDVTVVSQNMFQQHP